MDDDENLRIAEVFYNAYAANSTTLGLPSPFPPFDALTPQIKHALVAASQAVYRDCLNMIRTNVGSRPPMQFAVWLDNLLDNVLGVGQDRLMPD